MNTTYSFQELCLPVYEELVIYTTKKTKNQTLAQDIVQDVMMRAWKAWDNWEPAGEPYTYARAWLYHITNNAFKTSYTKNRTIRSVIESSQANDVQQSIHPEHEVISMEIGDEVQEALDRIRPEWAEVCRVVYIEGKSEEEASEELKIPRGSVRSRMARGRLALARILGPIAQQRFGLALN